MDKLTEKGWDFRFVGADIDPLDVSRDLGMDRSRVARFRKEEMYEASNYMAAEVNYALRRKKGMI